MSRNIIFVVLGRFKLRRMRWAGYVIHIGEKGKVNEVLAENLRETIHLENLGEDGRITFSCILKE
jgi:hypothetical protein